MGREFRSGCPECSKERRAAEAINHFGGKSKLAAALGISYAAVQQWGEEIPLLRQYEIEKLTRGALKVPKKPKAA
ncbi:TPA: Cro/Cl family transcriptional regulator [Pseudomonas aeruginosa]|nr:Cro/Cl family transcriptional regulator [Pseudomonas aeruginosa]